MTADILMIKLPCNKHNASTERPSPTIVEEEAQFLQHIHDYEKKKSLSKVSTRPKAKNDCVGEAQQQFN
jgi:hypothetical protein